MKKIIAFVLFMSLLICCFAACGKNKNNDNSGNSNENSVPTPTEEELRSVLPGAEYFKDISDSTKYPASVTTLVKANNGYVVVVNSSGYDQNMFVMCGIDNMGKIVGVEILKHNETPEKADAAFDAVDGLDGAYTGQGITDFELHTVAGATATSKGVANAIKLAVEIVTELVIGDGFNILDEDISQYIEIDEKYYKGYDVLVDSNRVTDFDINNEINKVLCSNKNKTAVERDGVISVGDVAKIYYRGYYLGENGEKIYFNGGCNFPSANPSELEIGLGSFISGFEYNLIGMNKDNYAVFSKLSEG